MAKRIRDNWGLVALFGLGIVFIFAALRLYNLTLIPVFVDEAIYVRWAQVMRAEPTLRFLPLSDGKQPLFMWLVMPFLKIFADPLVAGRLVSVFSGFAALVGVGLLTWELFRSRKAALIASLLYAVLPFTVFFDRMALVDSLLTSLGIWVLYLGILLVRHARIDLAMITGMALGAALITKSPAIFYAALLPSTAILLPWKIKINKKLLLQLIKLAGLWLIVYFFAAVIYNALRLGPNFRMIAIRNQDYVFTLTEVFSHPLDPFGAHLEEIVQWFTNLLTWPVVVAAIFGVLIGAKKHWREILLLLSWTVVPLLVQAEFAKVFTPRYILYTIPPLIVLAAVLAATFWQKFLKIRLLPKAALAAAFTLALIPALFYDYLLLARPEAAPLPRRMRYGYLEEWTAGTGIKEAAEYLKGRVAETNVLIGTEGYFGTPHDGLKIYLEGVPNITIIGVGIIIDKIPQELENSLVDNEVYLLVNRNRMKITDTSRLTLIAAYPKADGPQIPPDELQLYRLEPQE